jgi:hypothetical protein
MADVVSKSKANKIEPDCTYPCPCRKQGELCPIMLTDALGCSHCHHIFVVHKDGYTLEQVSSAYPYKQLWYWTGRVWSPIKPPLRKSGLTWLMGTLFFGMIVLLVLLLAFHIRFDSRIVVWALMTFILSILAWLIVYRQS